MRKWTAFLVAAIMMVSLVSCSSTPEDVSSNVSGSESASSTTGSELSNETAGTDSDVSGESGNTQDPTQDGTQKTNSGNNKTTGKTTSKTTGKTTSGNGNNNNNTPSSGSSLKIYDLKGKTVKILLQGSSTPYPDPDSDTYDQTVARIKAIEEAYNCKLSFIRDYPFPGINDYIVSCAVAGVDFADIAWVGSWWVSNYIGANIATPLDDTIDFSQPYLKNNKAIQWSEYKGKHYTMPVSYMSTDSLLAYNKDILSRLGYDPFKLQQSGEWTWDKFLEIARKATVKDASGKVTQWGVVTVPGGDFIYQIFASNNTDVVSYDGTKFTNAMKDNDAVIECFDFMKEIQGKCGLLSEMVNIDPPPESGAANWKNGTAAMAFTCVADAKNYTPKNVGFVLFPKGPSADKYYASSNGARAYMVPSTSKIQKEAAAILYAWNAYWEKDLAGYMSDDELEAWATANEPGNIRQAFCKEDLTTFSLAVENARMMNIMRFDDIRNMVFNEIFPDVTQKNVDTATALANRSSQAQKVIDDLNKSLSGAK